MVRKQLYKLILCLMVYCVNDTAYAADPVAKEDMTPPIAEGPLTAAQIPPIDSKNKLAPALPTAQGASQVPVAAGMPESSATASAAADATGSTPPPSQVTPPLASPNSPTTTPTNPAQQPPKEPLPQMMPGMVMPSSPPGPNR